MNTKNIIIGIVVLLLIGVGIYFITQQSQDAVVVVEENPNEEMMPVEPDGGIGDGAQPLDEMDNQESEAEETIGTSVGGQAITAYHFGNGETEVLIVGGAHGSDAPSTNRVANEFVQYYSDNESEIPDNITLTIIPNLNPDGLAKSGVAGRFNNNNVDLNRNFDCEWSETAVWQQQEVSGGSRPFSEPEAAALRDYVEANEIAAAVVYFASEGKVYPSACAGNPSTASTNLSTTFATAAGYPSEAEFDAYAITGDMVNWMAQQNIPAISVLLTDRTNSEFAKNQAGLEAVLASYAN